MNVIDFEDSQCKRIRSYLDSYLNNELIVETNHEVLTHLEKCESCSRSLEGRARLKAQLKRAVMQEHAPAALRERVGADLRRSRGFSFNRISLSLAAAAAVLLIAVGTFLISRPTNNNSPPLKAEVNTVDVTGQILKIGYDNHVYCAIDHNLANRQFTAHEMSEKLGPEYSGLLGLVKEKVPLSYTIKVGHRCRYQGREFVHLIMRNQDDVVSLVITRKNGEAFPAGGAVAVMQASGVLIYETSWDKIQVAGLETRDYLAFVISNKTQQANEEIASRFAPVVSDFLKKLEA